MYSHCFANDTYFNSQTIFIISKKPLKLSGSWPLFLSSWYPGNHQYGFCLYDLPVFPITYYSLMKAIKSSEYFFSHLSTNRKHTHQAPNIWWQTAHTSQLGLARLRKRSVMDLPEFFPRSHAKLGNLVPGSEDLPEFGLLFLLVSACWLLFSAQMGFSIVSEHMAECLLPNQ